MISLCEFYLKFRASSGSSIPVCLINHQHQWTPLLPDSTNQIRWFSIGRTFHRTTSRGGTKITNQMLRFVNHRIGSIELKQNGSSRVRAQTGKRPSTGLLATDGTFYFRRLNFALWTIIRKQQSPLLFRLLTYLHGGWRASGDVMSQTSFPNFGHFQLVCKTKPPTRCSTSTV